MSASNEFIGARRRYRAMLRELKALEAAGSQDDLLSEELRKLEAQFPQLREASGSANTTTSTTQPGMPGGESNTSAVPLQCYEKSASADAEAPAVASTTAEVPTGASPSSEPAPTSATTADGSAVPSEPVAPVEPRRRGHNAPHPPPLLPREEQRTVRSEATKPQPGKRPEGVGTALFALQLYNETHQRSVYGPVNFMKTLAVGVLNALVHYFAIDPCSPLGTQLVPSLFCAISHVYILYTLFLKRRSRVTLPMLLVYVAFDFIPSIVATFVAYTVTLSCLSLAFGHRVNFRC